MTEKVWALVENNDDGNYTQLTTPKKKLVNVYVNWRSHSRNAL
jgi:hypothetical protein